MAGKGEEERRAGKEGKDRVEEEKNDDGAAVCCTLLVAGSAHDAVVMAECARGARRKSWASARQQLVELGGDNDGVAR
ncbi:hypothetical protein SESBI_48663 [Sesbania bispinosa]|nr:hypothetical protein SESBI_48663 [Sesbania bispinosa]